MLIYAEVGPEVADGGCSEGCTALAYWVFGEAGDWG